MGARFGGVILFVIGVVRLVFCRTASIGGAVQQFRHLWVEGKRGGSRKRGRLAEVLVVSSNCL